MKEALVTDRMNFLIWQYLLEGNYRETAAKFQKEWHIEEPQRKFDFAPYVKTNSLVDVVNLGLHYYDIKRQYYAQRTQNAVTRGVFGPDSLNTPLAIEDRDAKAPHASLPVPSGDAAAPTPATSSSAPTKPAPSPSPAPISTATPVIAPVQQSIEESDITRKRQIDSKQSSLPNGSPVKKPRLSNGHDATTTTAPTNNFTVDTAPPTPMDIDSAEAQHAYPSPMERDTALTPAPRTEGPEQSTQVVVKTEDLGGAATFLRLSPTPTSGLAVVDSQQPGHENPIVLHCEWNPQNPSVLAAAGTDTLARIWTISRATNDEPVTDHVGQLKSDKACDKPYKDLVDEAVLPNSTVTALAWNPSGTNIALAVDSGSRGSVSIWAPDATRLLSYNIVEPPVFKLRWNPNGSSILGLNPENGGTMITLFSATISKTICHVLPDHDLTEHPLEAIWTTESDFLLCGGSLLAFFRIAGNDIVPVRSHNENKAENFVLAQYDALSKLTATANDMGEVVLWDESGDRRVVPSPGGIVTSLVWQPLQSTPPPDERLIAAGTDRGQIVLWNARMPANKPKYSMKLGLPAFSVSFTPDGAFIAAASPEHILIWKVGEQQTPRANWNLRGTGDASLSSLSPKTSSEADADEEDTYSLCWDASGHKLAYAVNSKLAVINF